MYTTREGNVLTDKQKSVSIPIDTYKKLVAGCGATGNPSSSNEISPLISSFVNKSVHDACLNISNATISNKAEIADIKDKLDSISISLVGLRNDLRKETKTEHATVVSNEKNLQTCDETIEESRVAFDKYSPLNFDSVSRLIEGLLKNQTDSICNCVRENCKKVSNNNNRAPNSNKQIRNQRFTKQQQEQNKTKETG